MCVLISKNLEQGVSKFLPDHSRLFETSPSDPVLFFMPLKCDA